MKLQVPYYSQFADVKKKEFKPDGDGRACAMACLKMAIEYVTGKPASSVDELFEEALIIQQDMLEKDLITEKAISYGLPHDIIVFVAHNHGVPAYKEEFKSVEVNLEDKSFSHGAFKDRMLETGINKLVETIRSGNLAIVSVPPGFSSNKTVHTVLLIGVEESGAEVSGFYYHNPDDRAGSGKSKFVSLEAFRGSWRRLAIFIGKVA